MTSRSTVATYLFPVDFELPEIDRLLPAGAYRVETEEELIESLSFPVYRRVATTLFAPIGKGSFEAFVIDPKGLSGARASDG